MKNAEKKPKSSVRHTRAIQVDRQKRPLVDNLTEEIEELGMVQNHEKAPLQLNEQKG